MGLSKNVKLNSPKRHLLVGNVIEITLEIRAYYFWTNPKTHPTHADFRFLLGIR